MSTYLPAKTEVNVQEWDWKLVHQTLSANSAGIMLDMCERLVPPRAVDALTSTSTK